VNDFYKFIWSGGGYHNKDIRKRNTPNNWKSRRMRSIKRSSRNSSYLF